MPSQMCPNCGFPNPESALTCYCSYNFQLKQIPAAAAADTSLTAAEALILLDPRNHLGKEALKLTLLELLAHRLLTVHQQEQPGFLGIPYEIDLIQWTPDAARQAPTRAHVLAVLEVLSAAGAGTIVPMKQVVEAMREKFGSDLMLYQTKHIVPELAQRGLLDEQVIKIFWIFKMTVHQRTAMGETVRLQLKEQIEKARGLPALLSAEPAQAAALAATLGSAVFLAEELRTHYAQLSRALRDSPASSSSSDFFLFDLAAYDAVDRAWEAFDAGFDGGEGGDGGGGDGGGGE